MKNESLLKNECLQLCTKMWQALPAALLPWPGFPCGSWWQAASQRKGGKQRLYRHLVNLWELLRSYQTKRGLMLDKELIQTPVSRRDRGGGNRRACTENMGRPQTRMHFFFFTSDQQIDMIRSEVNTQHRDVWQHAAIQQVPRDCRGKSIKCSIAMVDSNTCVWYFGELISHSTTYTVNRLESPLWLCVQKQGHCQVKCMPAH